MQRSFRVLCVLVVLAVASGAAIATPINPFPGWAPDDGTAYFDPLSMVTLLEFSDFGNLPGVATTFGFYFQGADVTDGSNLITIFGPEDLGPLPLGTNAPAQLAKIDFDAGTVYDVDDNELQSTFMGGGSIGFFYGVQIIDPPTFFQLFSDNAFNPPGKDSMGSFRSLSDPDAYLLAFEEPLGLGTVLSFHIVNGVVPAVPEPSATALFGFALIALMHRRRRSADK